MKHINILIMAFATVAFTGCKSLYGKYERPDINTKGLVRDVVSNTDTLAVSDTASFGHLPWKEVFTDPKLQNLINLGLEKNTNLLNAALNVRAAEAQLKAAKLAFLPSFSFSPQGTIASWDGNTATKTYQLPVNASWNIDLFGNLLSQKRSTQMALLASKDYQLTVKTNIISSIANMYYTLLMLDKQVKIVNDMESLTKDTWNLLKIQKELGRVRSVGVATAEANYYSVQTQKADLLRQIRETENALSLILAQPAQAIDRGTIEEQKLPSNLSTGVAINMLNNRPDVHASEMALAQCFYDVQNARSKFYPSLTINGSGAFTNSGGLGITNPGKWLLSAVGSLVQPIFQRGQIIAGLKVAKVQYERAYNTWQQSVLNAGSEVSNALVKYNTSAQKSELEAKRISTLSKSVDDTKLLLQQSTSTYLEVITAQQTLLNAELSKVSEDFTKMQAIINLYQALGGGVN